MRWLRLMFVHFTGVIACLCLGCSSRQQPSDQNDASVEAAQLQTQIANIPAPKKNNAQQNIPPKQELLAACVACHGPTGARPILPAYPAIAGQSARYISTQIQLISEGQRHSGLSAAMRGIAQTLSTQDIQALSTWFARQSPKSSSDTVAIDAKTLQFGKSLFQNGDFSRHIPSCAACHGSQGEGNPGPPYPRIAGQSITYLEERLHGYHDNADAPLHTPGYLTMRGISQQLRSEDIQALAIYIHKALQPHPTKAD